MKRLRTSFFRLQALARWWRHFALCGAGLAVLWGAIAAHARFRHRPEDGVSSPVPAPVLVAEPAPAPQRFTKFPARASRASTDEPPSGAPNKVLPVTPLHEEEAARHLARALHRVVGSRVSEMALAVLWAHWAHETGRGKRMLGHNFAGLKGEGTQGGARVWTREKAGQKKQLVRRTFRVYESPEEGALDYVTLLLTRYRGALSAAREGRTDDFVGVLRRRGYYTDENGVYEQAIRRLALECRRRSLARRAVEVERNAGSCACHDTPASNRSQAQPSLIRR